MNDNEPSNALAIAAAYMEALQAKDRNRILSLLAESFMLEVPFDVSGQNSPDLNWCGLDEAAVNYDNAFKEIDILKYTDVVITPSLDSRVAFVEGWGDMKMANGELYKNRYIFRFDILDGKIERIREYLNPITGAIAFGYPLPAS